MLKLKFLAVSLAVSPLAFAVYDGGKWKVDEAGNLVKDATGNPIYVNTAGAETSVDGATISRLNGEAKTHRERAETAETKLKAFEGLDPEKARAALKTVETIDMNKLVERGEIDKARQELAKQYDTKIAELDGVNKDLTGKLNKTILGNRFATSGYAKEKLAIPVDMAQAFFGDRFEVDSTGQIFGKKSDGNRIMSNKRMGEPADFEEALEIMVGDYPNKNSILKANDASGTGNHGGGANPGGGNIITRAQFEKLSPAERAKTSQDAGAGKIRIVDAA